VSSVTCSGAVWHRHRLLLQQYWVEGRGACCCYSCCCVYTWHSCL